jgi:hypothetical protein
MRWLSFENFIRKSEEEEKEERRRRMKEEEQEMVRNQQLIMNGSISNIPFIKQDSKEQLLLSIDNFTFANKQQQQQQQQLK